MKMKYFEMLDYLNEIELLSPGMLIEWRYKCNFANYPYIFEGFNYDVEDKTLLQLWEQFKEIWCIDVNNYDEKYYNEKVMFITDIYFDPDFLEYLRKSNRERFNEYSVIEQYEICESYVYALCENIISNECVFDEVLKQINIKV